jgi:hypothetical protein
MSVALPRLRSRTIVAALLALCAVHAHAARLQEARPLMGTVVEITADGVIVDRDGSVWMSDGFRRRLKPAVAQPGAPK